MLVRAELKKLIALGESRMGPPTGLLRQIPRTQSQRPWIWTGPPDGQCFETHSGKYSLWQLIPKRRGSMTGAFRLSQLFFLSVYLHEIPSPPQERDCEESPSFQKAKGREQRLCPLYSLVFCCLNPLALPWNLWSQGCDGPEGCDQVR